MAKDEDHIEQPANKATPAEDAALMDQTAPTDDAASNTPRPPDHPAGLPWPPKWREYPPDHPACQENWTPEGPFNEDWAREDFGDEFVYGLKANQEEFRGDWWLLAMMIRCAGSAAMANPKGENEERFAYWNNGYVLMVWGFGVVAHLEHTVLSRARLEHIKLMDARLEYSSLFDSQLQHADLSGARLEHADLSGARLEHASFCEAQLEHANLSNAQLEYADLRDARLEHAYLGDAGLEHADLRYALLRHADLRNARLEHADLWEARLEHANLQRAGFEHANLQRAQLEHAKLRGGRLDHADVRGATGILFDENPADRLHIEGNALDPWSRLRREYTGPRFFFHLLLLVAFLIPYVARVLHLSALSEMHDAAERMVEHVENTPGHEPWAEALEQWTTRFRETHEKSRAAWVLMGGNRGWLYVALTTILVVYNGLRAFLTWRVSLLRDAEERSKITPALRQYMWMYRLHQFASFLLVCAVISFLYNATVWIKETEVWVPKMVE